VVGDVKRPTLRLTRQTVPESAVLEGVLQLLAMHPLVAWACRINSGAMAIGEGKNKRYVRFHTMPGMSDVIGQFKASAGPLAGRFIAIEAKRLGEKPTPDQQSFLDLVAKSGGFAMCATNAEQVAAALRQLAWAAPPMVTRMET
jgi:hypothetical protein